jgi:hypothetical protein
MNPIVTIIDSCKLKIEPFDCKVLGAAAEAIIDLDAYAGEYVHLWLDLDGSYSLDPNRGHYWHVADLQVPKRQYRIETEEIVQDGETLVIQDGKTLIQDGKTPVRENLVRLSVDLSAVKIITRALPE